MLLTATGAAFNTDEMFLTFPYNKLLITCDECKKINNDRHRNFLVKKIFRASLKIILEDIVDNNVTFWLPNKKCNMHMKKVDGEAFKNLRRFGKFRDIDLFASNFTGYEIGFYMYGQMDPRIKTVYVSKYLKDRITENTNNGMRYGDSINDKYIKDYYESVHELFPKVKISDIKRILNFAWKQMYLLNSYGGDICIRDKSIWCYIGYLKRDSLRYFQYYIKKLSLKIRVLYKRKKISWDGYYYFALDDQQYKKHVNSKGKIRKTLKLKNIMMYQILDECRIQDFYKKYIFRIPYIMTIKYRLFVPELNTTKAELIIKRDPLKFKDILINENEYQFL